MADCEARALAHGLGSIRWPDPWPTNDVIVARAMTYADRRDALREFALTAMRMAFGEGADLGEPAVVGEAARRTGIDPGELARAVGEQEIKDALRASNHHARSLGVFGVPTVAVGDVLFWGDDRLDEAADACARHRAARR
jgi:2-hydroxychromene-2-carboxylate isomerase